MRSPRFIRTLLMAALLVVAAGLLAPPTTWINTGVPSDAFWISKAFPAKHYDMVLAGDSRVLKGLSPAAMTAILPRERIYNFGFDHNAYTESYLTAIAALVDPSSNRKTIVLGISPQSLTPEAARRNGFSSLRENGRFGRFSMRYLSPYLAFFQPYNVYYYWDLLHGESIIRYYQHHYSDGWVASRKEPEDPGYQIARYRGRFEGNKVSPVITRQLFRHVAIWREQGIEVYGLRLPSSEPMLLLENQQSGFDQGTFIGDFENAGGVWLDFDHNGYHSYDGSHLREDAAQQISVNLAREIKRIRSASTMDPLQAESLHGRNG